MKFWVFVSLLLSSSAFAQQGKVAVIPLDQTEGSLAAASRMAEMLAAGGREVVYGEPVYEMVLRHRVTTDPQVVQEFVGMSERIGQGGNDFFYKGEAQARP